MESHKDLYAILNKSVLTKVEIKAQLMHSDVTLAALICTINVSVLLLVVVFEWLATLKRARRGFRTKRMLLKGKNVCSVKGINGSELFIYWLID